MPDRKERISIALRVLARLYSGRPNPNDVEALRSWAPEHLRNSPPDDLAQFIIRHPDSPGH
jgi:hypothetical protein